MYHHQLIGQTHNVLPEKTSVNTKHVKPQFHTNLAVSHHRNFVHFPTFVWIGWFSVRPFRFSGMPRSVLLLSLSVPFAHFFPMYCSELLLFASARMLH